MKFSKPYHAPFMQAHKTPVKNYRYLTHGVDLIEATDEVYVTGQGWKQIVPNSPSIGLRYDTARHCNIRRAVDGRNDKPEPKEKITYRRLCLARLDYIMASDEMLDDNMVDWVPVPLSDVGRNYTPGMRPMRRKVTEEDQKENPLTSDGPWEKRYNEMVETCKQFAKERDATKDENEKLKEVIRELLGVINYSDTTYVRRDDLWSYEREAHIRKFLES